MLQDQPQEGRRVSRRGRQPRRPGNGYGAELLYFGDGSEEDLDPRLGGPGFGALGAGAAAVGTAAISGGGLGGARRNSGAAAADDDYEEELSPGEQSWGEGDSDDDGRGAGT